MLVVKNLPASGGDKRDTGWIPGSGRYCGAGHGDPLLYSGLDNPMDRGTRWTTVYRVAKNQAQLKLLSMHIFSTYCYSEHCIKCLYKLSTFLIKST